MSLNGGEPKEILVKNLQSVVDEYAPKVKVGATEHGFSFSVNNTVLFEVNTWNKACLVVNGMKLQFTFGKA